MEAQLQIRQNAQEVQAYMKDLFDWEKSIKQKETSKRRPRQPQTSNAPQSEAPIRGRASGSIAPAPEELQQPAMQPGSAAARRPSAPKAPAPSKQDAAAHTYKNYDKWDKFDVDAAAASGDEEEPADAPARSARSHTKRPPAVPAPRPAAPAPQSSASAKPNTNSSSQQPVPGDTPPAAPSSSGRTHPTAPPPVPHPIQQNAEPSTPEEWRARGNSLFQASQYEDALECYSRSIAACSSAASSSTAGASAASNACLAYANSAMALLKLDRAAEAEQDASAAITLDPTYVKAYQRRGAARRSMQQWLGAACDFEEALRLEPGSKALQADRDECLRHHMDAHGLQAPTQQERVQVQWLAAANSCEQPQQQQLLPAQQQQEQQQQEQQAPAAAPGTSPAAPAVSTPAMAAAAAIQQPTRTVPDVQSELQAVPQPANAPIASPSQQQQQQQQQQRAPSPGAAATAAAAAAQQAAAKRLQQPFKQPRTSTDFESAWRSLAQDQMRQANYLAQLPAEQLPTIFKSSLTAQMLGSIARVALMAVASSSSDSAGASGGLEPGLEPGHAVALLTQLPKVPRFDMAAMCIAGRDKAELRQLWEAAVATQGSSDCGQRLVDARRLYKL